MKRWICVPGERFLWMSLMYIKKKRGPNTVPCGTPDRTGHGSEREPSTTTCCVRPWRNEADHERRESLIPIECILRSSVE